MRGDKHMIYGYIRVSTKGQAKDGNSLESQEAAVRAAGASTIFCDAFTGTKLNRHNSYKQVEQMTGISKSTLIRAKKQMNGGYQSA